MVSQNDDHCNFLLHFYARKGTRFIGVYWLPCLQPVVNLLLIESISHISNHCQSPQNLWVLKRPYQKVASFEIVKTF